MKRVIWLLLISACFAQDLKRPTKDLDGGAISALGCFGTNKASTAMPLGYDAAGLSTKSTQVSPTVTKGTYASTRLFSNWQGTSNTYSSLTLNVSVSSQGHATYGGGGKACAAYSTDGGSNWTSLICDDAAGDGFGQQTLSTTLSTTQNLANLRVGVCVSTVASPGGGGGDDISVYDIWTVGLTSNPPAGNGSTVGSPHRAVVVVN